MVRRFLSALGIGVGVIGVALGIYVAIWGWARFKLDFWPLDSSRVGPNLCASLFLVVLLIAHNEFVVIRHAEKLHESHAQIIRDTINEVLHPTDQAEADIAAQVEEQFRQDLLNRLDETTPGGIGTIREQIEGLKTVPAQRPFENRSKN